MKFQIWWWHGKPRDRKLANVFTNEHGDECLNIETMEELKNWATDNDVRVMPMFRPEPKVDLLAITDFNNFNQR